MKTVCIILADGFEDVEAITPIDYLRRAGLSVCTAALQRSIVTSKSNIKITADSVLEEIQNKEFDCVIVPGGGLGSKNIANNPNACTFIKKHAQNNKLIAAICAAPAQVLGQSCKLLSNTKFTCFPDMESLVPEGIFCPERVVQDKNIITARAAGCAGEFSIKIIESLLGPELAQGIEKVVLLK